MYYIMNILLIYTKISSYNIIVFRGDIDGEIYN